MEVMSKPRGMKFERNPAKIGTARDVLKKHGMTVPENKIEPYNMKHSVYRVEHEGKTFFLKEHPEDEAFADAKEVLDAINRGIKKAGKDIPNPTIAVIEHKGKQYVLQAEVKVQMAGEKQKEALAHIVNELEESGITALDVSQVSEHGVPIDFDAFFNKRPQKEVDKEYEKIMRDTSKRSNVNLKDLMED